MELEEARKAIADGKSLEPKLRQTIEELEENNKDLMVFAMQHYCSWVTFMALLLYNL